jgi:hypothetical protein
MSAPTVTATATATVALLVSASPSLLEKVMACVLVLIHVLKLLTGYINIFALVVHFATKGEKRALFDTELKVIVRLFF